MLVISLTRKVKKLALHLCQKIFNFKNKLELSCFQILKINMHVILLMIAERKFLLRLCRKMFN